jgi:translation initiation factor 1
MKPSKPAPRDNVALVYGTGIGRLCPGCRRPADQCACGAGATRKPVAGTPIRVARSTAGRGGKAVSVITGLPLDEPALEALAKLLKQACGTGGTVKDGTIEIQGEHRDRLVAELVKRGFPAKKAGG